MGVVVENRNLMDVVFALQLKEYYADKEFCRTFLAEVDFA